MKIILADDHHLIRDGVKIMLQAVPEYEIIAEVDNAEDLKQAVLDTEPDLVIMDYRMPGGGTITVLEYIKQRFPDTKVIALTGVHSKTLFQQLSKSRADGILLKNISSSEMLKAIEKVLAGEYYMSDTVKEQVNAEKPDLTSREFQILDMIAQGLNNNEIAEKLSLSVKTVENHRYNISHKLGAKNAVELLNYAREHGLVEG